MSYLKYVLILLFAILCCSKNPSSVSLSNTITKDTINLVPHDSIGVFTGDSNYVFGDIWFSGYNAAGQIVVYDRSASKINIYDSDGIYVSSVNIYGQGPGQFCRLSKISIDIEGNYYLCSYTDNKVAMYNSEFDLLYEFMLEGGISSPSGIAASTDTSVVVRYNILEEDSIGTGIALFNPRNGEMLHEYRRIITQVSEGLNASRTTNIIFTVNCNGVVFYSDDVDSTYTIIAKAKNGDSLGTFGIESYLPVERPDSIINYEYERARNQYLDHYNTLEGFNYTPAPFWNPVAYLAVDSSNCLWVRGNRNSTIADVFTESGGFLYTAQGHFPEWVECDGWNFRLGHFGGILVDPRNPEQYPVVYAVHHETQ